jgi:hypothetical protein
VVAGAWAARYWGLVDTDPSGPIEMLVPAESRRGAPGLQALRVPAPLRLAHPARQPPVLTVEHTVLSNVAQATTDAAAVDVVLKACRMRLTTPARLLESAGQVRRLRRRRLLETLCTEVREGVTSQLEREYRARVCRAHDLPVGRGQARAEGPGGQRLYRDLRHDEQRIIVELDGRLGHEVESEVLRDQYRDNHATLTGDATLRFGWLAVLGSACSVADQLNHLLVLRGWLGTASPCGPACVLGQSALLTPGAARGSSASLPVGGTTPPAVA